MRRASLLTVVGLGLSALLTFAAPPSGGLHLSPVGGPIKPIRTPQGQALRNLKHQVTTQNWSGYAVAKYNTGMNYTSASATWVVPAASTPPGYSTGYSSSWVGVGGFCLNSSCSRVDKTLIQLGTEQDASSGGVTQYYAWWEALPQGSQIIHMTINPGDTVVASLSDGPSAGNTEGGSRSGKGGRGKPGGGGRGQTWRLSLADQTTGESWTTTLNYNSSLASAEWIEEAPYSGGILPLADFQTSTFDPNSANGADPNLSSSDGIVMADPNGQTSNVSVPDSDLDGFNACWGNGTSLTSCPAPRLS